MKTAALSRLVATCLLLSACEDSSQSAPDDANTDGAVDAALSAPTNDLQTSNLYDSTAADLVSPAAPDSAPSDLGHDLANSLDSANTSDLANVPPPDMAALPLADPGAPGPFKTTQFDLNVPIAQGLGGNLGVTIYGPSDDGTTLSQKGAPYPLIVFSPGFSVSRKAYTAYTLLAASHGFLVVAQDYRNSGDHAADAADGVKLITWLLSPTGNDAPRVAGRPDPARIATSGHSLGGKVSFLIAESDPRVKAVFGIDPVNSAPPFGMAPSAIAGLPAWNGEKAFLGETTSSTGLIPCAPAADNYEQFFQAANSPTFAITFTNAAHNDFVDQSVCLLCGLACGGSKTTWQKVTAEAAKLANAWFRWKLLGDVGQSDYLLDVRFQADARAMSLTLQTR